MAITAIQAKDGDFIVEGNQVCEVLVWTFEGVDEAFEYRSNCTNGSKTRVGTGDDSTGTFTYAVQQTGGLPAKHGDELLNVELHVDKTGSNYIGVDMLIVGMRFNFDINTGELAEIEYSWEQTGTPTFNGILAINNPSSSGA